MLLFEEEKKKQIIYTKVEVKKNTLTKETALDHLNVQDDGMFTIRCLQSNKDILVFEKSFDAEAQIKKGELPSLLAIRNLFMSI